MKKLLVLSLVVLFLLSGCGNKSTNVSDKNTVLLTVGNIKITKGDFYETMVSLDGGYTAVTTAGNIISNTEIETTDEIKADCQEQLDAYKEYYGDKFLAQIQSYGYTDEEDFFNALVNQAKGKLLEDKYFEDNKTAIYEKYNPVKAKMMYFEITDEFTAEDIVAAASLVSERLKAGDSFDALAETYGAKLTEEKIYARNDESLDYNVLQFLLSCDGPSLSDAFLDKKEKGYYIVQVTVTNQTQLEEDFLTYLKSEDDYSDMVDQYYFSLHNFTIYDVDVYNSVKTNYPANLVQD